MSGLRMPYHSDRQTLGLCFLQGLIVLRGNSLTDLRRCLETPVDTGLPVMQVSTCKPRSVRWHLAQIPVGDLVKGSSFDYCNAEIPSGGESCCNGKSCGTATDDDILPHDEPCFPLSMDSPLQEFERAIKYTYVKCSIDAGDAERGADKGLARGVGKEADGSYDRCEGEEAKGNVSEG